jgi:hypothetical protein
MIGDLKPQKFVDGRQCFFVLSYDPHSTAMIDVFILILQLFFERLEHRYRALRWANSADYNKLKDIRTAVTSMFTPEDRARLRSSLLEFARNDSRITGAAVTGSAADLREDEWSDVDLAFGVSAAEDLPTVLADWTTHMYDQHHALHHFDVIAGAWIYRVFLLFDTLQVDLAFVAETEFRALAPTFRLIFGKANEPRHPSPPQAGAIMGMAWLYALHARSCIARRKLWQAEYMISGVRDNALALACIRHGLPAAQGRGMDLLPTEIAAQFEDSLVRQLNTAELSRAFKAVIQGLIREMRNTDAELAGRLEAALTRLTEAPAEQA